MKVVKVGIELEGAFKKRFKDREIHLDGSVTCPKGVKEWKERHLGEVSSPALDVEKVEAWVREHYPDAVNASCGLHVHVSFGEDKDKAFERLSTRKFYKFFLEEMEKWGKSEGFPPEHDFWARLHGKNEYCKKAFVPSIQAKRRNKTGTPQLGVTKGGDRYCQLNFCYTLYGTVEARLLPGFPDVEVALRGISKIIGIFDAFLGETLTPEVSRMVIAIKGRPRKVEMPKPPPKKIPGVSRAPDPYEEEFYRYFYGGTGSTYLEASRNRRRRSSLY